MNCQEALKLLHAYIDDELDATGSISVEQHIHSCPDCRQAHRTQLALRLMKFLITQKVIPSRSSQRKLLTAEIVEESRSPQRKS